MKIAIITGSNGLVGSEAVKFFHGKGFKIIGIDNDKRSYFFGKNASTSKIGLELKKKLKNFSLLKIDIRNYKSLEKIFKKYKSKVDCIIHTAAQPSHDWAIKEPETDFTINANGTLNLLELVRKYSKKAKFIFVSTNKVYGDKPNKLPLIEKKSRFEISKKSRFSSGINEKMSIDNSTHSLFGVSKVSADLLVQEYGKNIGMSTVSFRLGCITGPVHAGAELHGFLSYLIKANATKTKYKIYGYKGKQVRDNIDSRDLVKAFWEYYKNPKKGEVYNLGGGRKNSCSILEAINKIEKISNIKMKYSFTKKNRTGDHIWYITNNKKFSRDYPNWKISISLEKIFLDIFKVYKKN